MTNCPEPRGVMKRGGKSYLVPCRKPTCPSCSKYLKARLLDKVNNGFSSLIADDHSVSFVTLTLSNYVGRRPTKLKGKKYNVPYTTCNTDTGLYFARFRAYLAKPRLFYGEKVYFRKLKYFAVRELTEKGKIHLHVCIDQYIPYGILQDAWSWATFNTTEIVKINSTDAIRNCAGYMSKYMTKNFDDVKLLRKQGVRRYTMSKDWLALFTPDYFDIKHGFKLLPKVRSEWVFEKDPYAIGLLQSGAIQTIPERSGGSDGSRSGHELSEAWSERSETKRNEITKGLLGNKK